MPKGKQEQARRKEQLALLRTLPMSRPEVVARLFLVVEYETSPDASELVALIDKARELGGVELAQFEHLAPTSESLI